MHAMQASLQYDHVTRLQGGALHQVYELLQLEEATHGLVLDLGGLVFRGDIGDRQKGAHKLVVQHACTSIRNGTLELPTDTQLVVVAPGCLMEDLAIRGPGVHFDQGLSFEQGEHWAVLLEKFQVDQFRVCGPQLMN